MRKTKYTVKYTTAFKKDYKRAIKRGLKIELLEQVVALLSVGEPLPDKNRDHDLSGGFSLSAKVPVPGHGTCVHGDDVCCKLNTIILRHHNHTFFFIKGDAILKNLLRSPSLHPFRILLFFDLF